MCFEDVTKGLIWPCYPTNVWTVKALQENLNGNEVWRILQMKNVRCALLLDLGGKTSMHACILSSRCGICSPVSFGNRCTNQYSLKHSSAEE
ncbi:hypothetical protein DICVIV_01098 [Dictyocaulus viviparus]|uniref:Uncharacterized protein n=1 Tax=Dictyocaulus viviparus TaxID=29172 RepID=A0A0D8Y9W5_DICVI|nr:hypothetical protein DICVIV_01098 [Dictyocaulus viviparus]